MAKAKVTGDESQQQWRARLAQLEQELAASQEAHKRALADFANLEHRTSVKQQQQREQACQELMRDLLPTLDHLNLAVDHQANPALGMITADFQRALGKHGLEPIRAHDQTFDPQTMEAAGTAPGPQDQVIREEQRGYQLNGAILRPARVIVGNGESK